MPTTKPEAKKITKSLGHPDRLSMKPMFGEYALYVDDHVVGLICDNQLYLKIVPASHELEASCKKGAPYEGTKEQYIIDPSNYSKAAAIALKIGDAVPKPAQHRKDHRV